MLRPTFILLSFITLLLPACKPDWDAPCRDVFVNKKEFSNSQRSLWPYNGRDSVYFVSAFNDSVLGINTSEIVFYNGQSVQGNPECPPDSNGFIGLQRVLQDSASKLVFIYTITTIDSMVKLDVNGSALAIHFQYLGNDSTGMGFRDSVQLNNRWFFNLHEFANAQGDSFYYSTGDGLIRWKNSISAFTLYNRK